MMVWAAAPLNVRFGLLALLVGLWIDGRCAWVWQSNEYGKRLADQAAGYVRQLADRDLAHGREREEAAAAALGELAEQKTQRQVLENRLLEQGRTHWKEMNDAQQSQARMRDKLATADLRLSVLADAAAITASGCDERVPEATGTGGMVHGAVRAQLDPAFAKRIIAITGDGDRGLIALSACQAYIREISK
ncbi:MAG TPA: lysis system i-spanin subunit Rz [Pseudomonas sp.]|nr:lysis system i-spanin subunit Rz [Pseudomonas sp.]